jgi:hypothetical protein
MQPESLKERTGWPLKPHGNFAARFVIGVAILLALHAGQGGVRAQGVPQVLASYTFEGSVTDVSSNSPSMIVTNAPFIDGALFLNGIYGPTNANGYVALAPVPGLSYDSFTFRLEFKPASFTNSFINVVSAGPAFRWLGLSVEFGVLSLRLNLTNISWLFQFPEAQLATNDWNQIVISLNASTGRVLVFLNGVRLRDVQLNPGFRFNAVGTASEQAEKVFNFNNYGNATSFHGSVDNFKVYNRALSETEVGLLLFPRLNLQLTNGQVIASWPGDLTGYRLQSSPGTWPLNPWATLPQTPQNTNGLQVIRVQPTQAKEFLRIARP